MTKKSSPFESPRTPTTKDGLIENIERDLRRHEGEMRIQEVRMEPLASREWVYRIVLKYTVPILGGLIFLVGSSLVGALYYFNHRALAMILEILVKMPNH